MPTELALLTQNAVGGVRMDRAPQRLRFFVLAQLPEKRAFVEA
jgi:hypothetical protein